MAGILYLFSYVLCGGIAACVALKNYARTVRLWAGLVMGLVLMMWLPALCAFFLGFTVAAHVIALALAIVLAGAVLFVAIRSAKRQGKSFLSVFGSWGGKLSKDEVALLICVIPLMLLCVYLLYTHVYRVAADGSVHVGQSTWGDLSMHAGFITSIAEQGTFPPEYNIFPGSRLSYPFLADSLSSSMYLLGTTLRKAIIIPTLAALFAVFTGFFIFASEVLKSRKRASLAYVMFILNGGLGFAYFFDLFREYPERIGEIFTGFYTTPTNLIDYNVRWVNIICDMLIPQRTLLFGWAVLFLILWLVYKGLKENGRPLMVCAGVLAGALPMIHTHSYLALALVVAVWMCLYYPKALESGEKRRYIANVAILAALAIGIALPQLFYWTFGQASNEGFLSLSVDWANEKDSFIWFWIKNAGLMALLIPLSYFGASKRTRYAAYGGLLIFLIAEFICFQPNRYDNNKLFYIWYALGTLSAADYAAIAYNRMKGIKGTRVIAAGAAVCLTLSAVLTIGREVKSDMQVFTAKEAEAAEYIKRNIEPDAVFLTGMQHTNLVAALSGRNIVCGSSSYVYFHGLDFGPRQNDIYEMYTVPGAIETLGEKYSVEYILVTSRERQDYPVLYDAIEGYGLIYSNGEVEIYAVQ